MNGDHPKPWPAMILAGVSFAAMLATGVTFWLSLGVLVLWCASLWLSRQEPAPTPTLQDPADIIHDARRALLESIGTPLVMFDRQRIVAANAQARTVLGNHILGQDARIALRHPEAMRLIELGNGDSVTIPGFVGGRTLWQLTKRTIDERIWLLEMIDRTAEADVGRAHTDFVANASHELRTPLAAVIGYVETLVDAADSMDRETRDKFHATVLREARRMQTLVSDLMSLSQVEAEKHDCPTEALDLAQLARRVAGEAVAIAGKGRVDVAVGDEPALILGDRTQLEQLVRNLVDNALKYGDPTTTVQVRIGLEAGNRIGLQVQDTGPGIAPEHLPHLTRRFYRTDPGRSRAAGGTGLGLAIVKHIVERHRGRLDIASAIGQGTTVSVTFPKAGS